MSQGFITLMNKYSAFEETDIVCDHYENGMKHEPVLMIKLYNCGANNMCPICCQGQGSSPCECSKGFIYDQ